MKVIFLDVDGVLNSQRNVAAQGGYPFPKGTKVELDPRHREENLDALAVGMVRTACRRTRAVIVLHSTWRLHTDAVKFGERWDLPIIGSTPHDMDKPESIKAWLEANEVEKYVILDDVPMGDRRHEVRTDENNGLLYEDYLRILEMLT